MQDPRCRIHDATVSGARFCCKFKVAKRLHSTDQRTPPSWPLTYCKLSWSSEAGHVAIFAEWAIERKPYWIEAKQGSNEFWSWIDVSPESFTGKPMNPCEPLWSQRVTVRNTRSFVALTLATQQKIQTTPPPFHSFYRCLQNFQVHPPSTFAPQN